MMGKLKRGKISLEEAWVILAACNNGTSVEVLARVLNRSEKSVQKFIDENNKKPVELIPLGEKDTTSIPDPPTVSPGHARKHFQIPDSKNPGQFRKGLAIMTEAGSQSGDDFLKQEVSGLLPMSSKHQNCITKAQND